jgi:LAS superfamily LD-carboxypeptidase LdcB
MRKKHFILISVVLLIVIVVGFILVKFVFKSELKAKLEKEKSSPTWSIEKYGEDNKKEEKSLVNTNAKKIDRNPESITVLVNKENIIDKDYKPTDLVEPNIKFSFNYKDEKRKMRKEAAENLELLFQGAEYYGYTLQGVSGFRSYERQKTIYEYNLVNNGFD